jgi:hypothetical protein
MAELTAREYTLRRNVRAFLLTATPAELRRELALSEERGDTIRARFVRELIEEEPIPEGWRTV